MTARILVAGIGNVFLSDDGFGPEVVRRVATRLQTGDGAAVTVVDYGLRGMHLAYDLLQEWDALVLVDALPDRGAPGTVHVFEADPEALAPTGGLEAHSIDPAAVFGTLKALGGTAPTTIVVGCEVAAVDEGMALSPPVTASLPDAVAAVERAVARLLAARPMSAVEGLTAMCLGIPGRVVAQVEGYGDQLVLVDVAGENRGVNIGMLPDETFGAGDWVIIHMGFVVEKTDQAGADVAMAGLRLMGSGDEPSP